jgi:pimeloyl-ACP methyl ester carboxylesterase
MEPFYFGPSTKPLFGIYHAPQGALTRGCGVVLCYPMGNEYIQCHRAYRQLAVRLSASGFPVLRFDFYGCGDSSGTCEQGQVGQWLTDIAAALREIRGRCALEKVCLVGCRLGGTLAAMVGTERGNIDGMVFWDPIVNGRAYIKELTTLQREMLPYSYVKPKRGLFGEKSLEILGFPLMDVLLRGLENIDLLAIQQLPAHNILLIRSNAETGQGRLRAHLQSIGAHVEYQHLPSPPTWINAPGQALVPHQTLQAMVSWISEAYL